MRESYIRVMIAVVNLMVTIMIEFGKVPLKSAHGVGKNVLKAITGRTDDKEKKE